MTEETNIDPNAVRKQVTIRAPQGVAWRVFTEQLGTWWPRAPTKSVLRMRSTP
jgi:hypothetical protein